MAANAGEVTLEAWQKFLQHGPDEALEEAARQHHRVRHAPSRINAEQQLARESSMVAQELAELEQQAAAEQAELQEEVVELQLSGIQALAYVLVAKLGSLKRAFHWLDSSRAGRMAQVEWDTGLRVLRLDLQDLTGLDTKGIFRAMDRSGRGLVQQADWLEFFREAAESMGAELQRAARSGASLAERARRRREADEAAAARVNAADRGHGEEEHDREGRGHRELGQQQRRGQRAAGLGGASPGGSEADSGVAGTDAGTPAKGSKARAGQLSEELCFRERVGQELHKETQSGLTASRALTVQDAASELNLSTNALPADFAEEVRAKLRGLVLGQRLDFSPELTTEQREVVHLLGAQLNRWTASEGMGSARHIAAFNLGSFPAEVRRRLEALGAGDSACFAPDLTEVQRKVVHAIAAELQLWSYTQGEGDARFVEVFNLRAFADQVRIELSQLAAGEQRRYPPSLSEQQRKVVHCIAEELGLKHASQGESAERCVVVGNLLDFRATARKELEALGPGEAKDFDASLSALQRKDVHALAGELGLKARSRGCGEQRSVVVARPGGRRMSLGGGEDEVESEGEDETEDSKMETLFNLFATGNFNGQKVFIGFRDLEELAEELRGTVLRRRFQSVREDLEVVFEDTLQLQIDFGTRTKKGLTLPWFQVFIQKVAKQLGCSVVGMLFAMLGDSLG